MRGGGICKSKGLLNLLVKLNLTVKYIYIYICIYIGISEGGKFW